MRIHDGEYMQADGGQRDEPLLLCTRHEYVNQFTLVNDKNGTELSTLSNKMALS